MQSCLRLVSQTVTPSSNSHYWFSPHLFTLMSIFSLLGDIFYFKLKVKHPILQRPMGAYPVNLVGQQDPGESERRWGEICEYVRAILTAGQFSERTVSPSAFRQCASGRTAHTEGEFWLNKQSGTMSPFCLSLRTPLHFQRAFKRRVKQTGENF